MVILFKVYWGIPNHTVDQNFLSSLDFFLICLQVNLTRSYFFPNSIRFFYFIFPKIAYDKFLLVLISGGGYSNGNIV